MSAPLYFLKDLQKNQNALKKRVGYGRDKHAAPSQFPRKEAPAVKAPAPTRSFFRTHQTSGPGGLILDLY